MIAELLHAFSIVYDISDNRPLEKKNLESKRINQ